MPIYEYLCQSCGKKFEVLQKFSDEPIAVHPECGGKVEKLISTSALQFKGSGWYVNDYAKGGISKPGETKAEVKSSDGSSDSKSDSKSESKPSTASESKPAPAASTSSTDSK